MNRKLLLLTAVVLMAVMLSGCKLLGEVDVKIKDNDGVLEEVKLGTADEPLKEGKLEFKANRFSEVVLEFTYKEGIDPEEVEWKRREKKLDVSELEDGDDYDYTLSFRTWFSSVEIEVKKIEEPTGE